MDRRAEHSQSASSFVGTSIQDMLYGGGGAGDSQKIEDPNVKALFEAKKSDTNEKFQSLKGNYEAVNTNLQNNLQGIEQIKASVAYAEQRTGGMIDLKPEEVRQIQASYQAVDYDTNKMRGYINSARETQNDFGTIFRQSVRGGKIKAETVRGVTLPIEQFITQKNGELATFESRSSRLKRDMKDLYTRGTGRDLDEDIGAHPQN
jgi:hypothetical protein